MSQSSSTLFHFYLEIKFLKTCFLGGGDILTASASPTIAHKIIETTKSIPGIRDPTQSYYEFWKNWTQVN